MGQNILFATNSNPDLALSLATRTGLPLGNRYLGRYADGEVAIHLETDCKNKTIYVLGSTNPPAENLIELFSLINTVRISGAAKVIAVIPYFGYGKSDHTNRPNFPVNARLFAVFLKEAGVDQVISVNLHSDAVAGYFKIPLTHLSTMHLLAAYYRRQKIADLAVATPDFGGVTRARDFASVLSLPDIIIVEKHRPSDDTAQVLKVTGSIKGRNIILADDMIQTGNTLISTADALKKLGAKDIYVAATHLVYSGPAVKNLSKAENIEKIVVTNSITKPKGLILPSKFHIEKLDSLLAAAIKP